MERRSISFITPPSLVRQWKTFVRAKAFSSRWDRDLRDLARRTSGAPSYWPAGTFPGRRRAQDRREQDSYMTTRNANLFRFASLAAFVWLLAAHPFAADRLPRFRGETAGSV